MPTQRQQIGRYGGLKSWSQTVDRAARTAPGRRAGPNSVDYWLARLDPERFADATDRQKIDAAEAARKAHFAEMAMRSARSRSAKAKAERDAERVANAERVAVQH